VLLQVMHLFGTKDFAEGINSFLEKRDAQFEGR
jgi:enoyl-CoA hydratase/carnithine racemase